MKEFSQIKTARITGNI